MYEGIPAPAIDPVLFQVGWLVVRWYSLAYIFGLLGAWLMARKMSRYAHSTFTVLKIDDFLVWATAGVIVGGRLGYVLFYNLKYFIEFPWQIFAVWQGGMSFHGGLLGVIAATLLFAHKKKISPLAMGDILVCVAPIGLFFGRLANFINGELYGRVTHAVPWTMFFEGAGDQPRHPSQLYEAFLEGLLLFIILNTLWWGSKKYRSGSGYLTGVFFMLYALFRFVLEFFREPDAHLGFVFYSLSMGQILCIPMFLFGYWLSLRATPRAQLKKVKENE
ncbi:MAG: prolipoprotein diacylglyceryl transferase [Lactobacillales bacterium]|jgi:phosphatidylglycerol:prolipoprotein diacylglycerol transferase|nr:prolipoprotein diacylglyceryl transferase [Lactobacillales bacterium]